MAESVLARLAQWGVRRIYGFPGDVAGEGVEFVPAPHEEQAAFMACAHAKFSGEVGVCLASSAAGAIHLLPGLYDARADHQPVLAVVLERDPGMDLTALLRDVAGDRVHRASAPEAVLPALDAAYVAARDARSVACVIVSPGLPESLASQPPASAARAPAQPDADALRRAAEVLNAGERVALLAGAGALHATDELIAVAERLGAGVAKTLLGKAAVPDDLPWVAGTVGLTDSAPGEWLLAQCDTLLVVGSSFGPAEFLPAPGPARAVQIDIDPARLGQRPPMEVTLAGDSRTCLRALLPLLREAGERGFQARVAREVARWWEQRAARALDDAEPVNPQRVFAELSLRLPERCIVTCDAGVTAEWFARDVRLRRGMSAALSGGLSSLGSAMPYAVAAKYAQPDRPVVALLGDGAMQMSGINTLIAIARAWREWRNPRLAVMVLNDGDPNEAAAARHGAESPFALADFPYAAYADLIGLRGIRVDHAEAVGPAWQAALNSDIPTLVEMLTDPRVAPRGPARMPALAAPGGR